MALLLKPGDENRTIALIALFWVGALMALFSFYFWLWGWWS